MPGIYVDGPGLAIERFMLQRYVGSAWQNSTSYMQNQRHRFRMLFRNYYSNRIPVGGSAYGNCDIHVADLRVGLRLPGASFDSWNKDSGIWSLMPRQVNFHPDFNDAIAPSTSRWFEFGVFTWRVPTIPASRVVVQVETFHREVIHLPPAPRANLVVTG